MLDFHLLNLLIHSAVTFSMAGIAWFVQLIHYPVMKSLPPKQVAVFEQVHWSKTIRSAVIMLSIELLTGILLLFNHKVMIWLSAFGLVLILAIWISTWGYCVPSHCALKKKNDPKSVSMLLSANALRAGLWSARSILVIAMLYFYFTT